MSTHICSPSLSTRKRIRVRDPSPDMFAVDEDDDDDSFEVDRQNNCVTPDRIKTQSNSFTDNTNRLTTSSYTQQEALKRDMVWSNTPNPEINSQGIQFSQSQQPVNYSMSSLMSSAESNHFGLNSRMNEALRSNNLPARRLEFSNNISLNMSCESPAIYSLNNNNIPTQTSIHAGPNFGLSDGVWKAIQENKGIEKLYDWQIQCLNKAIKSHQNLLYSLPTSG